MNLRSTLLGTATLLGAASCAALLFGYSLSAEVSAPQQPLPFSHKQHAGDLTLECGTCHSNADPGERMGFPELAVCLQCHSAEASPSPPVRQLLDAAEAKRPIDWVRVYQIPSYVWFSHRAHLQAEIACATCHGPVAERERLAREGDISMAGCVNCHLEKGASIDCAFCHEPLE